MTVGERIKEFRINLGLTQDELAKKIGYKSRATVNKIESGEREITQSMIKKFADALHVSPSVIMGWEDFPEKTEVANIPIETVETASMIHEAENTEEIIDIVETVIEDDDYRAIVTASKELNPDEMKMVRAMIEGLVNNKE